jgi:hypothetical protein
MITGRFWHTLLPLPGGDLIAIGGLNSTTGALSSCEIYRWGADQWVEASPLSSPRARFSATVLDDGRILVAGGHNGTAKKSIDTCEVYDPYAGTWGPAHPMNEARGFFPAVKLDDGRVLVSGGFSTPGSPDRNSTEVYDPVGDEWTIVGPMAFPRHNHIMGTLPDGRVLAFGGANPDGGSHSNVEAFDPLTGLWSETGIIITGRIWMGSTVLEDDTIVTHGGRACISAFEGSESFSLLSREDRDAGFISILPLIVVAAVLAVWRVRIWVKG